MYNLDINWRNVWQITEEEKNYIAEEYLEIAEEQAFISGEENYYFSNEKIKKYRFFIDT